MTRLMLAALLATASMAGACSDNTPTTPTPDPVPVTDPFSGTLNRNGAVIHNFSVNAQGTVTATITSLSDSAAVVGMSLGVWNGASCAIAIDTAQATQGSSVYGAATGIGTLCVRLYDVGKISSTLDYQLSVTHF